MNLFRALLKGLVLGGAILLAGCYVYRAQKVANQEPYTIDLNLSPEVMEFEGFINYGSPIKTDQANTLGRSSTIILGTKNIPSPVFSTQASKPVILSGSKVFHGPVIQIPQPSPEKKEDEKATATKK